MGGYQPVIHRDRQGKRAVKPAVPHPVPHPPWPGTVSARG
ncbi:hypothetical protein SUDANB140_04299 [Streptomyces sp. enrichment culture]